MRPPQEPDSTPWIDGNAALDPARYTPRAADPRAGMPGGPGPMPGGMQAPPPLPNPPYPPRATGGPPRGARRRGGGLDAFLALTTFAASLILYGLAFGPQLGVGITLILLVHELGHYVVVRAKGLPVGLPIFIPFIGAYVTIRGVPESVRDEAEIALAGPLVGGACALACYAAYGLTGVPVLLPLAYLGFALNLLNLAPLSPLDGGRVARAFPLWVWLLGFVAAIGIAMSGDNVLALVAAALLGIQVIQSARRARFKSSYFRVPLLARLSLLAAYIGLAVALGLGTLAAHDGILTRPPLR